MHKRTSKPWKCADGKKDMSTPIAGGFDPIAVEAEWYDWWDRSGFFRPRSDFEEWGPERIKEDGQFVICLPPPNVTGSLHIGHALTNAVQDSVIRWRRMRGENALWIPGTDHAGIATQVVVEKKLKKEEGLSRHDLGREEFLKRVWKWKHEYASTIKGQLEKTASSLDWTREFFTMDDARAKAVSEAFCTLHERGTIERSTRLVNWCVALQSAISDLEVEHQDFPGETKIVVPGYEKKVTVGVIYDFYYEIEGTGEKLQIATTRPETILGDTAVAVHPEDPRYKHLHGKRVKCPFRDESIPIVLDPITVDMKFGTGVVKITPAHDPKDFECGKRHKLEELTMMAKDGTISMEGEFKGMKRFDCREAIIAALDKRGLFVGKKTHAMRIGTCQRTKDIVEPFLMPQWFMICDDAAKRALELEKSNELKLIPKRYSKIWDHWLGEIRPWCISRQLWWGHRIPAYESFLDGKQLGKGVQEKWVSGKSLEEAKANAVKRYSLSAEEAARVELRQDEDVLDTWFSSALLPHSALGWPNQDHADFKQFFPTQLLETGHDILFFWVARMVMSSLMFLDKLPFDTVYLHAMVRDKEGKKMSKTLGNVVDPIDVRNGITLEALNEKLKTGNLESREVERAANLQKRIFPEGIKQCGSDALRIGLLSSCSSGADVNLDIQKVTAYRHFCNKLWNAVRFGLYHSLGETYEPPATDLVAPLLTPSGTAFFPWSENELVDEATKCLKSRCTGHTQLKKGEAMPVPFACQWILHRLDTAVTAVNNHFERYEFSEVVRAAYSFWYDDFCDNFLEMTKPIMNDKGEAHLVKEKEVFKQTLFICLETGLRLIHPLLPFTTEELWNRLPGDREGRGPSVMIADYPRPSGWANPSIDDRMAPLLDAIHTARSMKASYQLTDKIEPTVYFACKTKEAKAFLDSEKTYMVSMARLGKTTVVDASEKIPDGCATQVVGPDVTAYMHVADLIDVAAELGKLEKKEKLLTKSIGSLETKMGAPTYAERVPQNVRDDNAAKLKNYKGEMVQVAAAIADFKKMKAKK
eukprot:TRINITY_DN22090_c0_g1_i1.p1 TRINITY_DN22090_c0_g1~~TRINITY_DN22090_c0_g1_i1.p1  ORF type:complete len:1040 (+),score=487.79 TRINITY_DN22090_c0_g1_i1:114-3233(+)